MIDDVRFWLQNSDKNFGWILKGDESVLKSTRRFDSHENVSPDFHPKLKIKYAEPVSVQKIAQTGLFHAGVYPNPFRERLTIEYHLDREKEVELRIINILGKEIRSLDKDYMQNGIVHVSWDGLDDSGSPVVPGMYYVILRADNEKHIIKVIKSL